MSCFFPIYAYKLTNEVNDNGKSVILFNHNEIGYRPYVEIQLPCGRCSGCRADISNEWALRCVHEASLYSNNIFITLTYNNENLPEFMDLRKTDFQLFMKRFRGKYEGIDTVVKRDSSIDKRVNPIRYFMCGEYGENFDRPHYHACIFNFDFDDKILFNVKKGNKIYTSEKLDRLWSKRIKESEVLYYDRDTLWRDEKNNLHAKIGYCVIGDVTYDSSKYVASYIFVKRTGKMAEERYRRVSLSTGEVRNLQPEYCCMSRNPGIGKGWYEKYEEDIKKDFVTNDGIGYSIPKYYDRICERNNGFDFERRKRKRVKYFKKNKEKFSKERMKAKKIILEQNIERKERCL